MLPGLPSFAPLARRTLYRCGPRPRCRPVYAPPLCGIGREGTPADLRTHQIGSGGEAEIVFTDTGNGLRPFAPVHLKAARDPSSGNVSLSWIRRTRVGGDSWLNEVPLGEETEEYDVLILDGPNVVRTVRVTSQGTLYTAAQQTTDFGAPSASLAWRVAQISRAYGRGVQAEALSIL